MEGPEKPNNKFIVNSTKTSELFGEGRMTKEEKAKYLDEHDARFFRNVDFVSIGTYTTLFKKILHVHGSIVECGVHQGSGVLTWGILSSIFEPVNHVRKIIGFDLCEVVPSEDSEWDANVGSRILYKLCGATLTANKICRTLI